MSTPKDTALAACRQLMEPIIGILLRNGVTHKDLVAICKQIYVQVASEEFGLRGRQTNLSRVAMLTGIDRKEVARVKDSLNNSSEGEHNQQHQDRLTRLLSAWHQDPDFCDSGNHPLPLTIEGEQQSFALLARRYGGDFPASALLKELKRVGVVEDQTDGKVIATKRYFVPAQSDPGALLRAGSVFHDLGSTLHHNLYKANKQQPLRFERRASNTQMSPENLAAFREFVEQEGQAFLEKIDAWLSEHEQPKTDSNGELMRMGVGTYLFSHLIEPPLADTETEEGASE
ncbi:MAG: hypothetical protein B0W54_19615 [Cellvibrio sp. 79]|nr:MAG: hypothetical protein B0W54_19615 [Cellvibrio sp. 79]